MASFFSIILIGISLSMDAFSLALVYGISGINQKQKLLITIIVGIYHFIMPLIGLNFGSLINKIPYLSINLVAFIILIYLGVELIISNQREEPSITNNLLGFLIFGLSVSIDSLMVGISLKAISNNYISSSITFMIISAMFTYFGLILGNIVGDKLGKYSKIVGGIILIILAIILFIV